MKTLEAADKVERVIRDYVKAWGVDRLKRGMGVLPEGNKWVSEHEMRDCFVRSTSRTMTKEEAMSAFGRGLRHCEDLGMVERDTAPMSTSIRLPEVNAA